MAPHHPPRFLKIVDDARSRVRETNVDEVKSRLDRSAERQISSSSMSAKTANSKPTTSPAPSTSAKASSSATSRPSIPRSIRRSFSTAAAVSAPPWPPTTSRKWATPTSFPWTAASATGARSRIRWRRESERRAGCYRRLAAPRLCPTVSRLALHTGPNSEKIGIIGDSSMSQIGSFALLLALGLSAYSFGPACSRFSAATPPRLASVKPPAAPASRPSSSCCSPAFVLVAAAFNDDFSIAYIYHHSNRDLPAAYKFAVLWSGQEGSLLFWSLLLAGYGFVLRLRYKTDQRLFAYASVIIACCPGLLSC